MGGSGLCELKDLVIREKVTVTTPYGATSDEVTLGEFAGASVAFIPRHGAKHHIPPHKVPYKANLWALKNLGVRHVLATCIVGSLKEDITPGTFVVPNQFINLTWGRDDTYDVDQRLIHLPMAQPYCSTLSGAFAFVLQDMQVPMRQDGTVVVIQGPRFSTIAESKMFALWGGDIVNMTQYPECYFARKLGLCYSVLASVTDHDVGVQSDLRIGQSTIERVLPIFHRNVALTHEALARVLKRKEPFACACADLEVRHYYEECP